MSYDTDKKADIALPDWLKKGLDEAQFDGPPRIHAEAQESEGSSPGRRSDKMDYEAIAEEIRDLGMKQTMWTAEPIAAILRAHFPEPDRAEQGEERSEVIRATVVSLSYLTDQERELIKQGRMDRQIMMSPEMAKTFRGQRIRQQEMERFEEEARALRAPPSHPSAETIAARPQPKESAEDKPSVPMAMIVELAKHGSEAYRKDDYYDRETDLIEIAAHHGFRVKE